jgi:hypothetical protein
LTIARSALGCTGDDALSLLFESTGSAVVVETVAEFTAGFGVVYAASTAKVVVIVRVVPAAMVPRLQGQLLVQAPEFDTKVKPDGVGSLTKTIAASDGPLLVTVTV